MRKIAQFIVNKYWLFFIIFAALAVYSAFSISRVKVEYDITTYLPADTDTSRAISIMAKEFDEFGTSTFLVKCEQASADKLIDEVTAIDGVINVSSESKDGATLFTVIFCGSAFNDRALSAYNKTLEALKAGHYNYSVPTPLVNGYADTLSSEMGGIIAISAAVILVVLFVTSKSFAEVLAFPVVFGVAALLNMGTNYWFGTISFVSNTVCIILQLALAIDYAIILCHRFTEEKDKLPGDAKGALVNALTKAIPEIASSSLTTVSGLVALMFMQLRLGLDLGMVLAKSIICSLITVFFLMPGVLLLVSKLMDRSRHRCFVPKVRFLGKGVIKIRYVLLAGFVALLGVSAWLSQTVDYCYSQEGIDTSRPSAEMLAKREAEKLFGAENSFVILVPSTESFETQREIIATFGRTVETELGEGKLKNSLGWAGIALPSATVAGKSYYITEKINYADLADMTGLSPGKAALVFALYAFDRGDAPEDFSEYRVVASELFEYVFSQPAMMESAGSEIAALKETFEFAKEQLVGKDHYRMVFTVNTPVESEQTFAFIDRLTSEVRKVSKNVTFAGASMSAYDLNASFSYDNLLISLLTVAFVFTILAITFKSLTIPAALVAVIQGAIFMNFSLPVIMGHNIFFFITLIASAIQMGATIDYAILMTNRFMQLYETRQKRDALIGAVSASFPTIITSGTIMTVASFLVGLLVSDPLISSMGMTLGKGTLISSICVLTALPALLYVLAPVLKKTTFKRRKRAKDISLPNPSLPIGTEE